MNNLSLDSEYLELLKQIQTAQLKAAVAINRELISLYWYVGKQIIEKQRQSKWGSNFLESLSHNLQVAFPKTKGFSSTNLKRMRLFAEHYPEALKPNLPSIEEIEAELSEYTGEQDVD